MSGENNDVINKLVVAAVNWRKKDKAMLGNKGDETAIKESVFATRHLRQKADAAIAQDKTDRALPP